MKKRLSVPSYHPFQPRKASKNQNNSILADSYQSSSSRYNSSSKQSQYQQQQNSRWLHSPQQITMIRQDVEGRLRQKLELIAQRQTIEQFLQASDQNNERQIQIEYMKQKRMLKQLGDNLQEIQATKKSVETVLQNSDSEMQALQDIQNTINQQYQQLQDQCNQKYSQAEDRLVEFCDKHNLIKVVKELLSEYRHSNESSKCRLLREFVQFARESLLTIPKTQQLESIIYNMKRAYDMITREGEERLEGLQTLHRKVQKRRQEISSSINQKKQKQYWSAKVNEEICMQELKAANRQIELMEDKIDKYLEVKVDKIYRGYLETEKERFEKLSKSYGKNFAERMSKEALAKFHGMIRAEWMTDLEKVGGYIDRIEVIDITVDNIVNQIQKRLVPLYKTYFSIMTQVSSFNEEPTQEEEDINRSSPYQYGDENQGGGKENEHNLGNIDKKMKINLNQKLKPLSKDKSILLNSSAQRRRTASKSRHNAFLVTQPNEYELIRRTANEYSNQRRIKTLESLDKNGVEICKASRPSFSQNTIVVILNRLSVLQTSVYKKAFIQPPLKITSLEVCAKMGYAHRLLNMSSDLNLQFRMGKSIEGKGMRKIGNVDQIIEWQRIKKIQRVRQGPCLTIFLDKGVQDLVFKSQDQFQIWYPGLMQLFRNRGALCKVKQRIGGQYQ